MPYYRGDYIRGYYRGLRGDPGFFDTIGSIASKIGGVVKSVSSIFNPAGSLPTTVLKQLPGTVAKTGVMATLKKPSVTLTKLGAATAVAAPAAAGLAGFLAGRGMRSSGRRYRRMNVCNQKALKRAIRRSQGFAKVARQVLRFTSPHAPKGRAVFKTKRRK